MAYSGPLRPLGSARVAVAGAAAFVAGSNSGYFSAVAFNGAGDTTLTVAPQERFYSPRATFSICPEGGGVFFGVVRVAAGTTVQVLTFNAAGAPTDFDYGIAVRDVFIG